MECQNCPTCKRHMHEWLKNLSAHDSRAAQNLARMENAQGTWAGCCCSGNCPDLSTTHCAECSNRGGKSEPRPPKSSHVTGYRLIDGYLHFGYYGKSGSVPIALCSKEFCEVLQKRHKREAGQIWLKHMGSYRLYGPTTHRSPALTLRDVSMKERESLESCDWHPSMNLGAFCWGLRRILNNEMLYIHKKFVVHWDTWSLTDKYLPPLE